MSGVDIGADRDLLAIWIYLRDASNHCPSTTISNKKRHNNNNNAQRTNRTTTTEANTTYSNSDNNNHEQQTTTNTQHLTSRPRHNKVPYQRPTHRPTHYPHSAHIRIQHHLSIHTCRYIQQSSSQTTIQSSMEPE